MSKEKQTISAKRGIIKFGAIIQIVFFACLVGIATLLVFARIDNNLYWGFTEWVLEREIKHGQRLDFIRFVLGTKHEYGNHEQGRNVFMELVEKSDVESVYHYLVCGVDANTQVEGKGSVLCAAVRNGNLDIVKLLLSSGASSDYNESSGCSPVHEAVKKQHAAMVELLLNRGVNPNTIASGGRTALSMSVETENIALLSLLLKMGGNVNHIEDSKQTLLHLAMHTGNVNLIEMLLEAGVNVNKTDGEGKTALEYANRNNRFDLVDLLRKHGAIDNSNSKSDSQPIIITEKATVDKNSALKRKAKVLDTSFDASSKSKDTSEVISNDKTKDKSTENHYNKIVSTKENSGGKLTQVRALGEPIGTWQHKGKITLTSVTVRAKNLTPIVARKVSIEVILPDNSRVTLEGPSELQANETGIYELQIGKNVYSGKKLKAEVSCENCH